MIKTLDLTTEVTDSREIRIMLPEDFPIGPAQLRVVVRSEGASRTNSFGDLLNSEFFGMWQDRDDIEDSANFARQLRRAAWSRGS